MNFKPLKNPQKFVVPFLNPPKDPNQKKSLEFLEDDSKTEEKTPSTDVPIQAIFSWFGRLTPQLKNYLVVFRQRNTLMEFVGLGRDVFQIFRQISFALVKLSSGAQRAAAVHQLMDEELEALDLSFASCKKGCSSCCHSEKHITSDEADLIANHVAGRESAIREKFHIQAEKKKQKQQWSQLSFTEKRCPLLNDEGACSAYEVRPAVCRKHFVSSPVASCRSTQGKVQVELLLVPEIIASAALNLPDQKIGSMANMVAERLAQESAVLGEGVEPGLEASL